MHLIYFFSLNTKNQKRKLMNKLRVNNVYIYAYASMIYFSAHTFYKHTWPPVIIFMTQITNYSCKTVTCEHSYQLRKQFSAGVKITFLKKKILGIVTLLIKPLEFCFCLLSLNRSLSFWSTEVNPKVSDSQTFWFRIPLHSYWGAQRALCLYGLPFIVFTVLKIKTKILKKVINLFKIMI